MARDASTNAKAGPDSGDAGPPGPPLSWALVLELIASVLLVATIWAVDYLPTHDGPQHIYLSYVGNHFTDPGAPYREFYAPGRPLTALGFDFVFAPLEALMPWRLALRVALSVIVLVWAWGARTLIVSIHPGRRPLGLLAMAAALQWSLYMGFFSYVLATGVGFFVLALAIRSWPWTGRRRVALMALLFLQALMHVFCAGTTGLILVLIVALRADNRKLRNILLVAAIGLPAMGVALYTSGLLVDSEHAAMFASMGSVWPAWSKRFSYLAYLFAPGPIWKAWPFLLIAAAGLIDSVRRLRGRSLGSLDKSLLVCAVLLFLAALLLPLHVRGRWEFLTPRFLPLAIIAGTAILGVERLSERWKWIASAVIATFVAASLLWSFWFHRALGDKCGEALSGLDQDLHRSGLRLPIILDTKCGAWPFLREKHVYWVEPLVNLGALYAVEQGGIVPYVFAMQPQIHPFVVTKEGLAKFHRTPDRRELWVKAMMSSDSEARSRVVQDLATYGQPFEDVILWGKQADADKFEAWGYQPDVRSGGLLIGRYEGCPTTMDILLPPGTSATMRVEYGWNLLERMEWGVASLVNTQTESTTVRVPLQGSPCGTVRVRIVLDRDASGSATPGDGFCEGADDRGLMLVTTSRAKTMAPCEIR